MRLLVFALLNVLCFLGCTDNPFKGGETFAQVGSAKADKSSGTTIQREEIESVKRDEIHSSIS